MVLVKLIGGLGNQMFQYAFGQAIALNTGYAVKYDTHDLLDRSTDPGYTLRDFELDAFAASVALATPADRQLFGSPPANPIARLVFKVRRRLAQPWHYYERQSFGYDPAVFDCGANTYFTGYWQNEHYFKSNEAQLAQAFALKAPLAGRNLELATQIRAVPQAVALHVRRGDYVSNAQANAAHGVCSPHYYEQAVRTLQARLGDITLFVFSDDPAWVQANMQFAPPTTYVSHNAGKASVEDMRLMSLCRHNIIANSSFSWWAAWLNKHSDKQVVAPGRWMQLDTIDSTDLIPATWLTI